MNTPKYIFILFSTACISLLVFSGFQLRKPKPADDKPDVCKLYGLVFIESSPSFADYRVFVENVEGFADLIVYREPNQILANGNGLWHITDARGFADFTIFLESGRGFADFSIFYTPTRGFAGCRNP